MQRQMFRMLGLAGAAAAAFVLSSAVSVAQQAPQYPLDDKLASEPAPWTLPGKWGKRGNWEIGRAHV